MRYLDNEATKLVHNEALFDMAQRHINKTYSNDDLMRAIADAPSNHYFDEGTMPFDAVTELYDRVIIEAHGWHGEYWIRTDMDEVMDELQCFFLDEMDYNLREGKPTDTCDWCGVKHPLNDTVFCTKGDDGKVDGMCYSLDHVPHMWLECYSCTSYCEDPHAKA